VPKPTKKLDAEAAADTPGRPGLAQTNELRSLTKIK